MVKQLHYEAPQAQSLLLVEEEALLQTSTAGTGTIEPGQDGGYWNL